MADTDFATYIGTGKAILPSGATESISFEIRQTAKSDIVVSCEIDTYTTCHEDVVRIEGTIRDGWSIVADLGEPEQNPRPWRSLSTFGKSITATRIGADPSMLASVSGPLLNLSFDRPHQRWERQIPWRGYDLDISVIPEYHERIETLEESNGILQTAILSTAVKPNMSLEEMRDEVIGICDPLSLATGHLVSLAGLNGKDVQGRTIMRYHSNSITHPFRTHAEGFGFTTNPRKLVIGWDTNTSPLFPFDQLHRCIYHFVDSITNTLFMESRAILCLSLLDALSKQYCKLHHPTKVNLKDRLDQMVKDLNIDITETPDICKVVMKSRHNLLHEGRFVSSTQEHGLVWETIQAHWLAHAFMTHLIDPQVGIRPIYKVMTEAGAFNPVSDYDL